MKKTQLWETKEMQPGRKHSFWACWVREKISLLNPKTWGMKLEEFKDKIKREKVRKESLLSLREALWEENYEACPRLISTARRLGTPSSEIREILEERCRLPKGPAGRRSPYNYSH